MALRAVPDHPKFANLKAVLAQPKGATMGWLEAVWHFTGRFTPQGNIGKYTDAAIEAWVEWNGKPGALIDGLISTGWLDRDEGHRLLVHDWQAHADKATKNALIRARVNFCTPTVRTPSVRRTYKKPESSTVSRLPVPVPEPVPVPVKKPTSAHRVRAVDVKVKKKTKTDLRDARYVSFKEAIRWYWDAKNPGIEMPWGPPDGKQLGIWLTEMPTLTLEQFRNILRNRLKSDVTHSDRIYTWIRKASTYLNGSVNAFGKPTIPAPEPAPKLLFVREDGSQVVPQ